MYSPSMQCLPLQDLLPGLFIVAIVDFDYISHVIWGKTVILPTPPVQTD